MRKMRFLLMWPYNIYLESSLLAMPESQHGWPGPNPSFIWLSAWLNCHSLGNPMALLVAGSYVNSSYIVIHWCLIWNCLFILGKYIAQNCTNHVYLSIVKCVTAVYAGEICNCSWLYATCYSTAMSHQAIVFRLGTGATWTQLSYTISMLLRPFVHV